MQTTITRDSPAVPWGFRLKGGAEYNVPLSILKVNEGSPSHYKLEVGDVIASIGSYPALSLKHEEALNIIRMFDLSLPLVIHRQQALFSPSRITPKSGTTPVVWRPQSASSYEPPSTPKSPKAQHFSFNQPQVYQPSYQPAQPQVFRPQVYQPAPQLYQPVYPASPPGNRLVVSPPPQSVSPIPPPPPLPDFSAPIQSYKAQRQTDASYNHISSDFSSSSANPVVPDALLNKVLSKSPMGQKPFSYTPGGLDLSHVRQSARVKRYEQMSSTQEMSRSMRQTSVGPEFGSQYQHRQQNSHYQNFNPPQATQFQTYSPPFVPAPPPPPPPPQPKPAAYFQPSQAALNRSSSVSTESFVVKSPKPSAAFNLTPELLQKTKNNCAEKRDLSVDFFLLFYISFPHFTC
ncbi:PDZ and LIM domain 3 isoform X13 [Brachionus plicatilis]|uniref:PDZ and LIM domain 3 isoform X13 n=1 Tax=Brachionus plicatilis TaxID=10195 RepID=A0A3M7SWX3_BRAPC|nr:PDZ and LIM domain 3 isoform X13 [Brachionus plicatilis]